jgi:hypothetical protein
MIVKKVISFKALAHGAARLASVSQRAALGAKVVVGEISVVRPTVAVASLTVGASASSIRKALRASTFERNMMVAGALPLSSLDENLEPPVADKTVSPAASIAIEQASSFVQAVHKKSLGPSRTAVDDLLDTYTAMSPSEQVAFGRRIGVERMWQPRQHKREHNGTSA